MPRYRVLCMVQTPPYVSTAMDYGDADELASKLARANPGWAYELVRTQTEFLAPYPNVQTRNLL